MNDESQKSQAKPGGNTKNPRPQNQLYLWMITLKYKEGEEEETISQKLHEFCKKFAFQLEKGNETKYLHWQIAISLKNKEYFAGVVNMFPYGAHIEPTKDGWRGLNYCLKEETRVRGPFTEKNTFIKTIKNLYPWQKEIENICKTEPNDRTIHWYWESTGCTGKTSFCKYMAIKHNAIVLGNGAFKDIAMAINDDPEIVLFNLTRTTEERFNYAALEAVKDGLIFSGKYESKMKIFNSPHVFVFSNWKPDLEALSKDRWNIKYITK